MPETPALEEVLLQVFRQNSEQLRAISPGEVIAWDKSEQTATIQPLIRDRAGEDRPQIYKVPVIQPIAYQDLQVGEVGLILFCDRNPARWWRDNQQSDPEGNASHHVSNAIFLPGLRSKTKKRTIPTDTAVLERPAVGGEVHLGVQGATKAAVHEDYPSDMDSLLGTAGGGLLQWIAAIDALVGPTGLMPGLSTLFTTVHNKVLANSYISPSVKVED